MSGKLPQSVLAVVVLTAISASAVAAHVGLISSSPAPGANLSTPPTTVTITFDDELDPDLSGFTVTGPGSIEIGSGEVDLTVADRNVLTGAVAISTPGIYTVSYRVAGIDGHQLDGAFSFGYQATSAIPGPTGGEGPDTAMRAPGPGPWPSLVGAAFLMVSAFIIRRHMGAR